MSTFLKAQQFLLSHTLQEATKEICCFDSIFSTLCSNKLDTLSNMISFIRKDSIFIKSYSWYIKLPHMYEYYNNDSFIIIIQRTTNRFGQRQLYMLDTAKLYLKSAKSHHIKIKTLSTLDDNKSLYKLELHI